MDDQHARSSKPVRPCNPRLGRFDSGAAPSYFVAANPPHQGCLAGALSGLGHSGEIRECPPAGQPGPSRNNRASFCFGPLSRAMCAEMAIRKAIREIGIKAPSVRREGVQVREVEEGFAPRYLVKRGGRRSSPARVKGAIATTPRPGMIGAHVDGGMADVVAGWAGR